MLLPVGNISGYVSALGKAYVYVASDPTNAASWALLGLTEGEIQADEKFMFNDFKLPEWTGEAVHARQLDGSDIHMTVPFIWGDATLYDKIAPSGAKGGGRSRPMDVVTKTVLIIPTKEVGTGLQYNGTAWSPTAPSHAIWLHKASFEPGQYAFKHADGGKVLRQVGIKPLFDDTKPEGQKLYTIGDVIAQGITSYRV